MGTSNFEMFTKEILYKLKLGKIKSKCLNRPTKSLK